MFYLAAVVGDCAGQVREPVGVVGGAAALQVELHQVPGLGHTFVARLTWQGKARNVSIAETLYCGAGAERRQNFRQKSESV
jgi:hypothetical protein